MVPESAQPAGLVSPKTQTTGRNVSASLLERPTLLVSLVPPVPLVVLVPMEVSLQVVNALNALLLVTPVMDRHPMIALNALLGLTSSTVIASQSTLRCLSGDKRNDCK
jgi:hypothetical protein